MNNFVNNWKPREPIILPCLLFSVVMMNESIEHVKLSIKVDHRATQLRKTIVRKIIFFNCVFILYRLEVESRTATQMSRVGRNICMYRVLRFCDCYYVFLFSGSKLRICVFSHKPMFRARYRSHGDPWLRW